MARYAAAVVAGTSITFEPGTDVLEFTGGHAAQLRFEIDGADLLVRLGTATPVRLLGVQVADLLGSSLQFADNSQFRVGTVLDDFLFGFDGHDYLDGMAGSDTIDGGSGNDLLSAGPGDDLLLGGSGQDTLHGSGGRDTLDGGEGDDTYLVDDAHTRVVDSGGFDTVMVEASYVKLPSSIEQVTYAAGAQALPYWIDALLPDAASGLHFAGLLDGGSSMQFAFPASLPVYASASEGVRQFTAFNGAQQDYARQALAYVASIVDLQFVETGTAAAPNTLAFGNNNQTSSTAYAYLPSEDFLGSDVFLGVNAPGNLAPTDGSYAALTLIHEIGHALGLEHPVAGGSDTPFLPAAENDTQWTVMSYNDHPAHYQLALGVLDIAALHYLYGPSPTARTGDDTYLVDPAATLFVWDGAGVDTVSAAALSQPVSIHLEPGQWGWVGSKAETITAAGQVTINFGSVLENLVGGSGADRLFGNGTANTIDGLAGDDSVHGGEGNDSLVGGPGFDSLLGGTGDDTLRGGEQADALMGGDGNDFLNGGKQADFLSGGSGNDTVVGAMHDDTLCGDGGLDSLEGGDGDDSLAGGPDADTLLGGIGDDFISGGQGGDLLFGGAGEDTLVGGLGADQLFGGEGADHFLFRHSLDGVSGIDILADLEPGVDVVNLSASIFTALAGSLGQKVGPGAHLVYDQASGVLAYDADGAASSAPIAFTVVGNATHPGVLGNDFLVVA